MLSCSVGIGLIIVVAMWHVGYAQADNCTDARDLESRLTCRVPKDMCGWTRINNDDASITWSNGEQALAAQLDYNENFANKTGRLESPLVCATGDRQFLLRFSYSITQKNLCELSVLLQTDNDSPKRLWSKTDNANEDLAEITVSDQPKAFKILVQVRKLHTNYAKITIHSIAFMNLTGDITFLADDDGLPGGAVAALVIVAIIVITVCVVIVVLLWRRKATGRIPLPTFLKHFQDFKKTTASPNTAAATADTRVDNDGKIRAVGYPVLVDSTNEFCAPSDAPSAEGTRCGLRPQANRSGYDQIADTPISSNHYSMLVDGKSLAQDYKQEYLTKRNNLCHELEALEEPDDGYSTPEDLDSQKSTVAVKTTGNGIMKQASSGDYNKLCLQNPRSVPDDQTAADTYSHIQEQENEYKVPRTDTDDYCLAKQLQADGSDNHRPSAAPGKPRQGAGDYNHLNLKGARSANAVPSDGSGQSDGEYSHLND